MIINYVLAIASDATFKSEEPDFISKDGVFTVTETGKKHGFKLAGNGVMQGNSTGVAEVLSGTGTARALMDHFIRKN